jgi:hypothetical protein
VERGKAEKLLVWWIWFPLIWIGLVEIDTVKTFDVQGSLITGIKEECTTYWNRATLYRFSSMLFVSQQDVGEP